MLVVGVGGAGNNALAALQQAAPAKPWWDITWVACCSDLTVLGRNQSALQLPLEGEGLCGIGCGGDPMLGRAAAFRKVPLLREWMCGASLVIVAAGLGGGSGSGAAPVILQTAREMGITTVSLVTLPFKFEGPRRMQTAQEALERILQWSDSVSVMPSDQLMKAQGSLSMPKAMELADSHLIAPALALLNSTWEPMDEWSFARWDVGPKEAGTDAGATVELLTPNPSSVEAREIWKWRLLRFDEAVRDLEGIPFTATSLANGWLNRFRRFGLAEAGMGSATGPKSAIDATRNALQLPWIQQDVGQASMAHLTLVTSVPDLGAVIRAAEQVRSALHPAGHLSASVVWKSDVPPMATAWLLLGGLTRTEAEDS